MFTVEELGREIAELAVHLDAATHRLLECVRQFDAECGWAAQGAVSCAHWLSWRIGLDPATAREKVRRGERRYPLTLHWLITPACFAPLSCPACKAAEQLVAGRSQLGCRRCNA